MAFTFVKIVSGPTAYATGGFKVDLTKYEKIEDASVEMEPDSIVATKHTSPEIVYALQTDSAVVYVKVSTMAVTGSPSDWEELADTSQLINDAHFTVVGHAV